MSTLGMPRVKTRDDVVWVVFCVVVCEGEVCVSAAVCEVAADGGGRREVHGHPGRVSKARIGGGGDGGRVPLAAPTEAGSAMQHPKVETSRGCGTWRSRGPFFFDSAGGELREAVGVGGELRTRAPRFQPRLSGSMSSSSRLALAAVRLVY